MLLDIGFINFTIEQDYFLIAFTMDTYEDISSPHSAFQNVEEFYLNVSAGWISNWHADAIYMQDLTIRRLDATSASQQCMSLLIIHLKTPSLCKSSNCNAIKGWKESPEFPPIIRFRSYKEALCDKTTDSNDGRMSRRKKKH